MLLCRRANIGSSFGDSITSLATPNDQLLGQLADQPWAMVERWLPVIQLQALREEAVQLHRDSKLLPAGVGRATARQLAPEIRSDLIIWLDPRQLTSAQAPLWRALDNLRVQLNRRFFLCLRRFEGHFAVYPRRAHYHKHVDQFRDAGHRRVSFVLYLNPIWSPQMGGALRLYEAEAPDTVAMDIWPQWGRLVVFLSDSVPHEVLITETERFSFTGWFRDDDEDPLCGLPP